MTTDLDPFRSWFHREGRSSSIVVSTRARLVRNVEGYAFPERLSLEAESNLFHSVERSLQRSKRPIVKHLTLSRLSPLMQRLAGERLLLAPGRLQKKLGTLWLSQDEESVVFWGGEDHLAFSVFEPGMAISAVAQRVEDWSEELDLPFSAEKGWGYLSSRAVNCGSGLKLSLLLHLPGSVRTGILDQIVREVETQGYSLSAFWAGSRGSSDFFLLSGQFSCGLSSKAQVEHLEGLAEKLAHYETQARRWEAGDFQIDREDRCGRAWGILTNARRLSWDEALFHLSALRESQELAILKVVPVSLLDRLLFIVQSAHLISAYSNRQKDEDVLRAEIVRKTLTEGEDACLKD